MKISLAGSITVALHFFILTVRSQTGCERMQQLETGMIQKEKVRVPEGTVPNDADAIYLMGLISSTDQALEKLAAGSTDKELLTEYHFCIVAGHSIIARTLLTAGKMEEVYTLLNSIKETAFALDDAILKNLETVRCVLPNGSGNSISPSDYQEYVANYYYCYMASCCFLNKAEAADKLFDHLAQYDLWNVAEAANVTAAIYVRFKWGNHVADGERVKASAYMLKKYTKQSVRDSSALPIDLLLQSLNDPALADTSDPSRANALYLIYQDVEFFRLRNGDDGTLTETVQSQLFAQVMRCMTYHTNIPELLEAMKYNNHPDVERIINLNDPVVLSKVIFMCEQYINRAGKNLREPYFWQSMAKIYTKAGNNDAANDALRKAKKYKY